MPTDKKNATPKKKKAAQHAAPDLDLDVSTLKVDEVDIEADALEVGLSLDAQVASVVQIKAGVSATLGGAKVSLRGVESASQLSIDLSRVSPVLIEALQTLGQRPELAQPPAKETPTAQAEVAITPPVPPSFKPTTPKPTSNPFGGLDKLLGGNALDVAGSLINGVIEQAFSPNQSSARSVPVPRTPRPTFEIDGTTLVRTAEGRRKVLADLRDLPVTDEKTEEDGRVVRTVRHPLGIEIRYIKAGGEVADAKIIRTP